MTALETIQASGPEWVACWERLVAAAKGLGGGIVPDDPGLPENGTPMSVVERYARAVSDVSNPRISLELTLPVMLATASVAGQGAFWTRGKKADGSWLPMPMVIQSTVVAPSGYGKSTVQGPMPEMIKRLDRLEGKPRRRQLAAQLRDAELVSSGLITVDTAGKVTPGPGCDAAIEQVTALFAWGICPKKLVIDQSTPEGARDHILQAGGTSAFMTAESDILREIGSYAKDSGSMRWFLDGWDGSSVSVTRSGGKDMEVPRACLPYSILLQPQAFDAFIQQQLEGVGNQVGGLAASGAIGKGVYGRSWLARLSGWRSEEMLAWMVDTEVGGKGIGEISEAQQTVLALEDVLSRLMERSSEYRTRMGIYIGWLVADSEDKTGGMASPEPPERIWLDLADDEALLAYAMVQNIRLALIDMLQQLELVEPSSEQLFNPMFSRWTQHVMRLATVLQLTVDPQAPGIAGWAMRDAALRLAPWLFEAWCAEMRRFRAAAAETLLEQEMKNNPRKEDQTFRGQIVAAIKALQLEAGEAGAEFVFAQGTVVREAKKLGRAKSRGMLTPPFNQAFQELVKKGALEKVPVPPTGKVGKPAVRWRLTPLSAQFGL